MLLLVHEPFCEIVHPLTFLYPKAVGLHNFPSSGDRLSFASALWFVVALKRVLYLVYLMRPSVYLDFFVPLIVEVDAWLSWFSSSLSSLLVRMESVLLKVTQDGDSSCGEGTGSLGNFEVSGRPHAYVGISVKFCYVSRQKPQMDMELIKINEHRVATFGCVNNPLGCRLEHC